MSGDEMERHLSLSLEEPELLRRAVTPGEGGGALFGVGESTPGDDYGQDERMEAPPDDVLEGLMGDPGGADHVGAACFGQSHCSLPPMVELTRPVCALACMHHFAWIPSVACGGEGIL